MNNFFRRLKYYGIGFGIGLIFVLLLFQQKGCSWTPGNRVKSAILERIIFVDSLDEEFLTSNRISKESLKTFIEQGTISFLKSKRNGSEKLYHFYGDLGALKSFNCIIAYREKSVVIDIDFEHADFNEYIPLDGYAKPYLYQKKNWFSGKWELFNLNEIEPSNAPEKFSAMFLNNGLLNCHKSTLTGYNATTHFILKNGITKDQEREYHIKTIWYKEKLEIKDLSIIDIKRNK